MLRSAVLIACLAVATEDSANADDPLPAENGGAGTASPAGLVLGFESVILPPYEFSGMGTDALTLNGLQYSPQPRVLTPRTRTVATPYRTQFAIQKKALRNSVVSAVAHVTEGNERLAAAKALFAASPIVEKAVHGESGQSLLVYWEGLGPEDVTWRFKDKVPSPTPSPSPQRDTAGSLGYHDALIQQFFHVVNQGGTVAFGDAYFVLVGDPGVTARTRALLAEQHSLGSNIDVSTTILKVRAIRDAYVLKWNDLPDD